MLLKITLVTNTPDPKYQCFQYKPAIPASWSGGKIASKSCLAGNCWLCSFSCWLLNYLVWIAVADWICSSWKVALMLLGNSCTAQEYCGKDSKHRSYFNCWFGGIISEVLLILARPLSNGVLVFFYLSLMAAATRGWCIIHAPHDDGFKCWWAHKQSPYLGALVLKPSLVAPVY